MQANETNLHTLERSKHNVMLTLTSCISKYYEKDDEAIDITVLNATDMIRLSKAETIHH